MDMKSISQKLQDDIRAIMEANLHPNQQKIDVHEPEKDEITAHDFKKLRAMKKKPDGKVHDCATHVEHTELGRGVTISEQHAEPDENGDIEWYAVQFDSGVYKVYTEDMDIIVSEAHHHGGMMKKEDTDLDEARKLEGTYTSVASGHQSKVYKLSGEHNEGDPYHVKLFKNGKHHEPADYFTNDKEDAHDTAKHMVKKSNIQELTGMAAQQAAVAISLIKAGKKKGTMPKPMRETSELEETKGAPKGHHFTKSGQLKRGDADQDGHGGPMLRADPKDKMRNKIPPVTEEEKKKIVSPFDYKNYKSQIPTKPGETAGFDSKKISTGTVYSRKPVKEESHQSKTTMKHIPNASPALKKAAKDIKPGIAGYRDRIAMLKAGNVKEEAEQIDEAYQTAKSEFVARQGRLTAAAANTEKDPERLKKLSRIPGYSAAMDLAKKTTQGAKHTKEEVEQMDELSVETMKSAKEKLADKAYDAHMNDHKSGARNFASRALKMGSRIKSKERSVAQMNKEEVEQKEYTFAEYLDAARAQYDDEDAVLIANEAFKNQDITLFADQSQSPEA